jgi:hypothetical protein
MMAVSPLFVRFLHGFVGEEASKEDVEAQVSQAFEGESSQTQEVTSSR